MNLPCRNPGPVSPLAWLALLISLVNAVGQTSAELEIHTYAGLTISGEVGKVYSVECVTDLSKTNDASGWRCLEFLQLPASPYLWADKSALATEKRFYRAVAMEAPTNMVFIPAGTFRMGSPTNEVDRYDNEGPQTDVIISRGFWMGKYEVTQTEYLEVMGSNPSLFNGVQLVDGTILNSGVDLTRPVEQVNWFEAKAYCVALTERERAAWRIPANALYRLPTEAEWEFACRAGTSTRFSYGDDQGYTNLTNYAWYRGNSGLWEMHPVGQKLPNPWGLHDMHGSVWEWCQDLYNLYDGGIALDPQGSRMSGHQVVRGGSWLYWQGEARYCRSAFRHYSDARAKGDYTRHGFRAVLAPGQP